MARKSKRNSSTGNGGEVPNMVSGLFYLVSTLPLRTFAPGQCILPSIITQFRWNDYEYSMKDSAYHFLSQSEHGLTLLILRRPSALHKNGNMYITDEVARH